MFVGIICSVDLLAVLAVLASTGNDTGTTRDMILVLF